MISIELHEKLGLKKDLLLNIIKVICENPQIERAVIFGSRAKESFKPNSDIDIAVWSHNLTAVELNLIEEKLDSLNTALRFDLLHFERLDKLQLKNNIEKDGVLIYAKRKA